MNFTFVVPGEPVPWARARTNGKRHYTAPKVAAYKRKVAAVAQACMHPRKPHGGPVVLEMRAVLPIPASWSAKRRAAALEGLEAPGQTRSTAWCTWMTPRSCGPALRRSTAIRRRWWCMWRAEA